MTFVDVTQVKVGEDYRRISILLRDSNDAITVQNFEGNISSWNRCAQEVYGYSEAEALKMNIKDIVPDNKRAEALDFIKEVQQKEVKPIKTHRKAKDGQVLDVWLTVTRLLDDEGKPVAVGTTERDLAWLSG